MTSNFMLRFLNLILPPGQIVVTLLAFYMGTSFNEATEAPAGKPPITPAAYAFAIWAVIYAGCVGYGVLQFLKPRDAFYERIRPYTASAFLSSICWLIVARFRLDAMTVVCILWMIASLLPVLLALRSERGRRFTTAERFWVVAPLSIFTGWVAVAVFVNIASYIHKRGLLSEVSPVDWALILLLVAGAVSTVLTFRTRNPWFALAVCWGLVAVVVANVTREFHASVAILAAAMTMAVLASLWRSRAIQ